MPPGRQHCREGLNNPGYYSSENRSCHLSRGRAARPPHLPGAARLAAPPSAVGGPGRARVYLGSPGDARATARRPTGHRSGEIHGGTRMCGIIGYVGPREAEPILVEGLRRLEYRGYDSAGLATLTGSHLHLRKRAGRLANLMMLLHDRPAPGCVGISHTRWATHGPASDRNAQPHVAGAVPAALVQHSLLK